MALTPQSAVSCRGWLPPKPSNPPGCHGSTLDARWMPCTVKLLRVDKGKAAFHDVDDYERLVDVAGAIDRRTLVVLGPSAQGDSAGEIHRVALDEAFPVDVSRRPRVRIPFLDTQLATLGSMALEPTTHDLFLGEENGKRVYRLDADERLSLYLDGLRRAGLK